MKLSNPNALLQQKLQQRQFTINQLKRRACLQTTTAKTTSTRTTRTTRTTSCRRNILICWCAFLKMFWCSPSREVFWDWNRSCGHWFISRWMNHPCTAHRPVVLSITGELCFIISFIAASNHDYFILSFQSHLVNRISATVVDIRPAAGTVVSLEDFFGA